MAGEGYSRDEALKYAREHAWDTALSTGKTIPAAGEVWRRKRNGRLVTVIDPAARIGGNFMDVSYDMGNGRIGYSSSLYWHGTFERAVQAETCNLSLSVPDESVSQQVTRLLGTDDWVILHSGHQLVVDADLDDIEGRMA